MSAGEILKLSVLLEPAQQRAMHRAPAAMFPVASGRKSNSPSYLLRNDNFQFTFAHNTSSKEVPANTVCPHSINEETESIRISDLSMSQPAGDEDRPQKPGHAFVPVPSAALNCHHMGENWPSAPALGLC